MQRAIISDIHSNLEALEAVLSDIRARGITETYCLGDIVGYGPNPRECLDLAMTFTRSLLGNHDQAALFDPEGFSSSAEKAIFWTRAQLEMPVDPLRQDAASERDRQLKRWNFLCDLPRTIYEEPYLFVHGSARNPLAEYVFPEDVFNHRKLERIFSIIPRYCFQGHTHVPGIFTESGRFLKPTDIPEGYRLGQEKVMINVGSVGQPRDGDPRACYVVLDEGRVKYHRVPYPVQVTANKIYVSAGLDPFLGDRLQKGQ